MSDVKAAPVTQADLAGSYAYRFEGTAARNGVNYKICGIGQFAVDASGALTGAHTSSSMVLDGSAKAVRSNRYQLTGSLTLDAGTVTGNAAIAFASADPKLPNVDGTFRFGVIGKAATLWLMSTGSTIPVNGVQTPIAELSMLEAVRIV